MPATQPQAAPSEPSSTAPPIRPQRSNTTTHGIRPIPWTDSSTCALCKTPSKRLHQVDPSNRWHEKGAVIRIHESVHTPVDRLFKRMKIQQDGPNTEETESRGGDPDGKPRPAIFWRVEQTSRGRQPNAQTWKFAGPQLATEVCLLTSYNDSHLFSQLPKVLRDHFAVPISPHLEIHEDVPHIHTSPEWQREHVWFLALPVLSRGKVYGRWEWKDAKDCRQPHLSFEVEVSAILQLRELCEKRYKDWAAACLAHAGYVRECQEEYEVSTILSFF